ncbi:MAG: snoRNA-binding rRNA-processing protein [Piccolia ochrophora]|nr:MAG: snoRNA-binding rRNA-processing protein [Piccolia ochrophora]
MPTKSTARSASARRHNPLSDDLLATGPLRTKSAKRKSRHDEDEDEDKFIDSKSSQKILKIGQDLAQEDEADREVKPVSTAFAFESRFGEDEELEGQAQFDDEDDDGGWADEEEVVVETEADLNPNDMEIFNRFMPAREESPLQDNERPDRDQAQEQGVNLADLILEKIAAHEAAQAGPVAIQGGGVPEDAVELPAKVVEVYSKIGLILSRYKSGKLPKPFKIIATLPNWETLLSITRPDSWTPNACYEATKIFVSAKPAVIQYFLETVMLDRVRADIHETKKLNVHLYNALKKALYKPAAFFKGFLFPLVGSGSCTLREAHIIASVLARVSVPVLHSAAALLRLCDLAAEQTSMATEGGGATNIFIRTLLDKKYALPYKVIDALVFHFLRYRAADPAAADARDVNESMAGMEGRGAREAKLPVLWHQSLLVFAQRYRNDITEDQREALLDLLLIRGHPTIGPEVRRELLEGRGRGVVVEGGVGDGGDDTMVMDMH